ncbi:MAG TPA: Xaa-Pro peptidase family protein [Candidatus Dormibacteraeota bacterium]|nr:Xaa-Pro peptidase family protein [Candidatus Dormibacteraeota bacterium]
MTTLFGKRRRELLAGLASAKLDGLLITRPANWYYLTGFTGDAGALLATVQGTALVTDGRFTGQARQETTGVRIVAQSGGLLESAGKWLLEQRVRRVGFDPQQLSVAQLRVLRKAAGSRVAWIAAAGIPEGLRTRKDQSEVSQMRKAAILASEVVTSAAKLLKPGVREFEIAAEIEYHMRSRGASGPAFETIVASGKRTALPHARPTAKRLRKNELVVLDLGAILGHYCSDITRTFYLGRAPGRIRGWYRAVQEAQAAAIAAVKAGAGCGEVDAAARQVLAGYRLDQYFVHSTGHGLGLEVHEDPRVAKGQSRRLESGNVVTIEPGVYVDGVGGIRIEDDVAVHVDRTEVLTRFTRDLIEI